MGKHQRLVADVMLAKLARWLRLAGIEVEAAEITDDIRLIAYVKSRYFYVCKKCGKIYWKGTHWKSITKRLKKARRIAHSY